VITLFFFSFPSLEALFFFPFPSLEALFFFCLSELLLHCCDARAAKFRVCKVFSSSSGTHRAHEHHSQIDRVSLLLYGMGLLFKTAARTAWDFSFSFFFFFPSLSFFFPPPFPMKCKFCSACQASWCENVEVEAVAGEKKAALSSCSWLIVPALVLKTEKSASLFCFL